MTTQSYRDCVLEEVAQMLLRDANAAYVRGYNKSKDDLCKGEAAKIETGKFTLANLKAIECVRAEFGAHTALAEAAKAVRLMKTEAA